MTAVRNPAPRALTPNRWVADAVPYRAGMKAPSGPGSLAQNEIPSASPFVVAAIADAASGVNRYPEPLATALRERLARLHGVDPEQILVGGGSDEFLFLLAAAFGGPGRSVCCADPPYWGHEHPALMSGAEVVKVPLVDDRHDLANMAEVEADIAFLCNPHNPTGTCITRHDIASFRARARAALVVVDEAYMEFADDPNQMTAIPLITQGDVVVLRTFSKYYGLAGVRVGYLIGSTELVTLLRAIRSPFSVNLLAQAAAVAALDHPEFNIEMLGMIRRNRAKAISLFEAAGYRTVPSQTNFLLVRCPCDEPDLVQMLLGAGVAVRPGRNLGIAGSIRVTIPNDEGLELLEDALTQGGRRAS